ncbi:MAG: hypothetical protein R3C11_17285 [Planctomycetaceae bacterium]
MDTDKHRFWDSLWQMFQKRRHTSEVPLRSSYGGNSGTAPRNLSMKEYVEQYVRKRDQALFVYDEDEFHKRKSLKKILFIATLWSGNSQMTLRKLGEYLGKNYLLDLTILIIDSDEETYGSFIPEHLYGTLVGYGPLLMYHDGEQVGFCTGKTPDQIAEQLDQFLKP